MKCAGCSRDLEVGDLYIEDAASGFMAALGEAGDPALDGLMSKVLGGSDNKIVYCAECTEPGGDYFFKTVNGDEVEA